MSGGVQGRGGGQAARAGAAGTLAVVIPTLDAARCLPACLEALGEGREAGLVREIVVSDGGSRDGTVALAAAAGARVVTGPASRGGQLRRGVAATTAPAVMLLHADTRLAPGWTEAVGAHLQSGRAGWFHLRFDAPGPMARVVAGWANLRARLLGLPYGDQGLVLPRSLLERVGGVPDQPLMEDVALARALAGRLSPVGWVAVTSAERYRAEGWLRRGARNLATLARYLAGAEPVDLARRYSARRGGSDGD